MKQNKQIAVPIICENPQCGGCGRVVNIVGEIEDMDLFYESYDGSDDSDYCRVCGKLGVAEDPVLLD
ncbi:MAG: hypothetical protein OXU22_06040 [Gammaproteobacteria bacterium]|nr:hypothetical protein [Gammaproteobacteria bacterium]